MFGGVGFILYRQITNKSSILMWPLAATALLARTAFSVCEHENLIILIGYNLLIQFHSYAKLSLLTFIGVCVLFVVYSFYRSAHSRRRPLPDECQIVVVSLRFYVSFCVPVSG